MTLLLKANYEIEIDATAEKVWNSLLEPENYKKWTAVFCADSYFTGELKSGGRVHFLTPDGNGMYSDVVFYTPDKNVLLCA